MSGPDLLAMLVLGALWGSSFLFMRIAAPAFGPLPLIVVRVTVAAVVLLLILARRGGSTSLRARARPLCIVGAINSTIPFTLFAYAAERLGAGVAAILNGSAPLFGAVVAYVWFRETLTRRQVFGLVVGFAGVSLVASGDDLRADGPAIVAGLLAGLSYGIAAHYIRRRLAGVAPLEIAAGSQMAAAVLLAVPSVALWPPVSPPASSWFAAITLGVACTAIAYLLYFRLLANVGAGRALVVAYLIPLFGMLWGKLFLGEAITLSMLTGCAMILFGVAAVARSARIPAPSAPPVSPSPVRP